MMIKNLFIFSQFNSCALKYQKEASLASFLLKYPILRHDWRYLSPYLLATLLVQGVFIAGVAEFTHFQFLLTYFFRFFCKVVDVFAHRTGHF